MVAGSEYPDGITQTVIGVQRGGGIRGKKDLRLAVLFARGLNPKL